MVIAEPEVKLIALRLQNYKADQKRIGNTKLTQNYQFNSFHQTLFGTF